MHSFHSLSISFVASQTVLLSLSTFLSRWFMCGNILRIIIIIVTLFDFGVRFHFRLVGHIVVTRYRICHIWIINNKCVFGRRFFCSNVNAFFNTFCYHQFEKDKYWCLSGLWPSARKWISAFHYSLPFLIWIAIAATSPNDWWESSSLV